MRKATKVTLTSVAVSTVLLTAMVTATHVRKKVIANASASATLVLQNSMFEFYDQHGHFPSSVSSPKGYPHSWRTLIENLQRERCRVSTIDTGKPWNAESNLLLAQHTFSGFDTLSVPHKESHVYPSSYFVVTGAETAFPPGGTTQLIDITDGAQNTVVVIELAGSDAPWIKPGDVEFSELIDLHEGTHRLSLDVHERGNALIFADGERFYMERVPSFDVFCSLFTISGMEPWTREHLVKAGFLAPR